MRMLPIWGLKFSNNLPDEAREGEENCPDEAKWNEANSVDQSSVWVSSTGSSTGSVARNGLMSLAFNQDIISKKFFTISLYTHQTKNKGHSKYVRSLKYTNLFSSDLNYKLGWLRNWVVVSVWTMAVQYLHGWSSKRGLRKDAGERSQDGWHQRDWLLIQILFAENTALMA